MTYRAMTFLTQAILIATEAHNLGVDKAGQPYILHPLRMIAKAKTDDERIVAALHDTIEDTGVTIHQLMERGFPHHILAALALMTKSKGQDYLGDYIPKIGGNPLATAVKLLDLEDNMDLDRLPRITDADLERQVKYHKARAYLRGCS